MLPLDRRRSIARRDSLELRQLIANPHFFSAGGRASARCSAHRRFGISDMQFASGAAEEFLHGGVKFFEPAPARFFEKRASYPWMVVGTVCIGAFIGQVDASIVQLALPTLEDAFGAPLHVVSWVAIGYMLAFASTLPLFARLAAIGGRKSLYLCGFALFGLFSMLCGVAEDLTSLIVFRLLQGASGAMLGANSLAVLVAAAGPGRRGKAIGIMAAAQAVGLSLGPVLGGALLASFGWRAIFWITVPFAVGGAALGWLIVPRTAAFAKDPRFDFIGAVLIVPALVASMLAITEAQAWGASARLGIAAGAGLVLLGVFAWNETKTSAPLIDRKLFGTTAFSAGALGVLVSYAMLYGMLFSMSFALIRGYHEQPFAAGLTLTIIPITLGLVAPFSAAASDNNPRLVMLAGAACTAAAAIMLMAFLNGSAGSMSPVLASLAAFGVGLGLYIAPNNNAAMAAAPPGQSAEAGGLLNLLRVLGSGIGVASASVVLGFGLGRAGVPARTAGVPEAALFAATHDTLAMLAGFAVLAAVAVIFGTRQMTRQGLDAGEPAK
jgi:EmrB/QacA subfamily drug resistance transporter